MKGAFPLNAILKLTRWQEFVPFTVILTWLGGLLAYQVRDQELDWRLLAVLAANLAAMSYAFMINDIEDAEDDARDLERGQHNPITMRELSPRTGWIAAFIVALIATLCYALGGTSVLVVGIAILALAHLYSWKPVRLKARPLVDILSHALFLSALLFLAAFFIYTRHVGYLWVVVVGVFLVSAYGQLYNQVRDYEADRAARLHNTASILGKRVTGALSQATVVGAIVCLVVAVVMGAFPLWLGPVLLAIIPPVHFWLRGDVRDMRGSEAHDPIGLIQRQFLAVINILLLIWLVVVWVS